MGFALWIDSEPGLAWAQGTHECRPLGTAVVSTTDQFRPRDFRQSRRRPWRLNRAFVGFFGSLEELNVCLRSKTELARRPTPAHLL